jgi:hypothetical protein
MLLEDTKHTSYIHDIDRELEDIESQEEHIAFIPDIEKTLTAIPRAILERPKPQNTELVLYRPPEYFALPAGKIQATRPSTHTVSSPKSRTVTTSRVLMRKSSDSSDENRLLDAQDAMDIDL